MKTIQWFILWMFSSHGQAFVAGCNFICMLLMALEGQYIMVLFSAVCGVVALYGSNISAAEEFKTAARMGKEGRL